MRTLQTRPRGRVLKAAGLAAGALTAALLYRSRHNGAASRSAGDVEDPLSTYIHDHLAGAAVAIDMLARLRQKHRGERLAEFASDLLAEIEDDREALQDLAQRTGGRQSAVKQSAAWLAAKAGELKVGRQAAGNFGSFQALEVLAIGIQGKLALWRAFEAVEHKDPRLDGMDFAKLSRRAQRQFEQIERWRLALARAVFSDHTTARG